ncbi:MAG TPA: hypothetical protein VHG09_03875 [Longimicrobiales bacterium]|nr:hypothetical protein [Longimicrobiales bacterium]
MTRHARNAALLTVIAFSLAACAVRLGGPSPEEYDVAALFEPLNADADAVAERLRSAGADIVLIAAERQDSAWFRYVAATAGLNLSGPGTTTGRGYAFMVTPRLEILGDTSLVLPVEGGGSVHMHDALYSIDEYRNIDVMLVRLMGDNLRETVQTLLNYIATDVPADAAILLALDGPTPEAADSAATIMRATIGDASECRDEDEAQPMAPVLPVRLLYGPSARVRCISARPMPGTTPGIVARLEVGR